MYLFAMDVYNMHSKGARALSSALNFRPGRMLRKNKDGSVNKHLLINWGCTTPRVYERNYEEDKTGVVLLVNPYSKMRDATDKLSFFKLVNKLPENKQPRVPEWTESLREARKWVEDGKTVMARTILRGRSGAGIVFSDEDEGAFCDGKLFTVYKKKNKEFRIHIAFGDIIDRQEKKLRTQDDFGNKIDPKNVNWRVRSFKNGFVFARNNIQVPEDVDKQAKLAIEATGLDFGAVDVIWNDHERKAYILEINTAPGIEGSTVESYVTAFRKKKKELDKGSK